MSQSNLTVQSPEEESRLAQAYSEIVQPAESHLSPTVPKLGEQKKRSPMEIHPKSSCPK